MISSFSFTSDTRKLTRLTHLLQVQSNRTAISNDMFGTSTNLTIWTEGILRSDGTGTVHPVERWPRDISRPGPTCDDEFHNAACHDCVGGSGRRCGSERRLIEAYTDGGHPLVLW